MAEYTPNSHKFKAEQKEKEEREKIEKVVTGKRKKKSELSKISNAMISEDVRNVKHHILMDVLIPACKNALSDVVTDAINMLLFGDTKRKSSSGSRSRYYSYETRFDSGYSRERASYQRSSYDFDDVVLDSRGEAEEILDAMNDILSRYGLVRVADMYELAGLTCDYTDNKYGWTSLRTAEIIRGRDGYGLKLPKAMPID